VVKQRERGVAVGYDNVADANWLRDALHDRDVDLI
jgi:hypothetical protein